MDSKGHRLIGAQLGTCVLERLIGSGGMGMVFIARQVRPTREVAVKVLRSGVGVHSAENEEFLARFRREANVIAQLDHVNILPIYEYGEQDGLAYLVMPYLTGGSLRDLLKRHGHLPAEEALSYVEQAAAALQYAHSHKIVHRDIKPGNMLFHADGRLVLVDFGIARIIHDAAEVADVSLTGSEHFIGSVEYMSPEMARGGQIDQRTDIYELGIVLFQMLTGQVPFHGSTAFVIAAKHIHEPPPSLTALNPAISPRVEAVVLKAIAKLPEERYSSAKEFALALGQAVHGPLYDRSAFANSIVPPSPLPQSPAALDFVATEFVPARAHADAERVTPVRGEYDTQKVATTELATAQITSKGVAKADGHVGVQEAELADMSTLQHLPSIPQSGPKTLVLSDGNQSRLDDATALATQITARPMPQQRRAPWLTVLVAACGIILLITAGFLLGARLIGHILSPDLATSPTAPAVTSPVTEATMTTPDVTPTTIPQQTPAQQAQQLLQLYYQDINNGAYQSAYQLWGADYQRSHPYQQFASGFSTTQHDDVFFQNATQLGNGMIKATITLYATEQGPTGKLVKEFSGTYLLGQENGVLKIEQANLQLITNAPPPVTPPPTPIVPTHVIPTPIVATPTTPPSPPPMSPTPNTITPTPTATTPPPPPSTP